MESKTQGPSSKTSSIWTVQMGQEKTLMTQRLEQSIQQRLKADPSDRRPVALTCLAARQVYLHAQSHSFGEAAELMGALKTDPGTVGLFEGSALERVGAASLWQAARLVAEQDRPVLWIQKGILQDVTDLYYQAGQRKQMLVALNDPATPRALGGAIVASFVIHQDREALEGLTAPDGMGAGSLSTPLEQMARAALRAMPKKRRE